MKPKKDKLKMRATLKEKRHYLILEILSSEKLGGLDLKNKVESCIKNFIGILGLASAGPLFVKIEERKTRPIDGNLSMNSRAEANKTDDKAGTYRYLVTLSITTKYVDYVKASLILWDDKTLKIKCVGVSGTILKAQRFL